MHIVAKTYVIPDVKRTRTFFRGYCDIYTNSPKIMRHTCEKLRYYRKEARKDAEKLKEHIKKQHYKNNHTIK